MNYLIRYFSYVILFITIIIFAYVFYRAEIIWNSEKSSFYLKYYIFTIFLFLFSIISFFFSDNFKKYLIIIFSSFIFSIYLFEFYLVKSDIFNFTKAPIKTEIETRSKLEVYHDLKKNNNQVSIVLYPALFYGKKTDLFPLSNISRSKTVYCNENGYYSNYESDRYGFNNPDSEWDSETIEYTFLGDSFVHGACVNRPDDIASVTRLLSKKNVLNLGFSANDPLIELATIKEYIQPNMKKIIWVYFEGNDLIGLSDNIKNSILSNYLNNENFKQDLKNRQNEVNKIIRNYIDKELNDHENFLKNRFFMMLKLFYTRNFFKKKENLITLDISFYKIIDIANKIAKKNNSDFYFVYIPDKRRFSKNIRFNSYQDIKDEIKKMDIPFIDFIEIINAYKKPLELYSSGLNAHFNEYGYKFVSEKIYNKIK